jgi:hypothetical protein
VGSSRWHLFLVATLCGCGGHHVGAGSTPARDAAFIDPRAALCPAADGGEIGPPSFDLIQQVFNENCVTCHTTTSDLDLSPGHAWANLVGHSAPPAESCGGTLVVPGNPDGSYLYDKLSRAAPCFGIQMPRGDFSSDPLPACLVTMVRSWIVAGALDSNSDAGGQ